MAPTTFWGRFHVDFEGDCLSIAGSLVAAGLAWLCGRAFVLWGLRSSDTGRRAPLVAVALPGGKFWPPHWQISACRRNWWRIGERDYVISCKTITKLVADGKVGVLASVEEEVREGVGAKGFDY